LDGVYLGGSLEAGNAWQDVKIIDFGKMILAGSVFVGMDTIIGPVYFAYGLAQRSRGGQFYMRVGKRF
jgi:NTE family protein